MHFEDKYQKVLKFYPDGEDMVATLTIKSYIAKHQKSIVACYIYIGPMSISKYFTITPFQGFLDPEESQELQIRCSQQNFEKSEPILFVKGMPISDKPYIDDSLPLEKEMKRIFNEDNISLMFSIE